MQLDSEVELARQLSVSRMTVRKALVRLEEEGHIFRRSGIGTFVKAPTPLEAAGRRLEIGIEASLEGNPRPFSLKILAEAQQGVQWQITDFNLWGIHMFMEEPV